MRLRPIGVVKRDAWSRLAELVVDPRLDGILDGIEGFSHILVLYWAHLIPPEERSRTRARPNASKGLPPRGIFVTRGPARPNPICLTPVRLLEKKENALTVEGLDALDGSPLIDIKPLAPESFSPSDVTIPEWWGK